ncbi:unnamed protein product [Amoebophrya sp. A120]|nr:unnamed protein product [Amoebophrya sp. A120]|eukprot:GSA120T00019543001.1
MSAFMSTKRETAKSSSHMHDTMKEKNARAQELRKKLNMSAADQKKLQQEKQQAALAQNVITKDHKFTKIDYFKGIYGFLDPDFPSVVSYMSDLDLVRRDYPSATAAMLQAELECFTCDKSLCGRFGVTRNPEYEEDFPDSVAEMRKEYNELMQDRGITNDSSLDKIRQNEILKQRQQTWVSKRLLICDKVQRDKFHRSKDLQKSLLETGERLLQYENTFYDIYWGTVDGKGQNQMGRILADIRQSYNKSADGAVALDEWLFRCLDLVDVDDRKLYSTVVRVNLQEVKENEVVSDYFLDPCERLMTFVGRQPDACQILPQHPSTSRRHAVFAYTKAGFGLTDLFSKAGCKVNKQKLGPGEFFVPLKENDEVQIGESTRVFKVKFDHKGTRRFLEDKQRELLHEAKDEFGTAQHLSDQAIKDTQVQLFVGGLDFAVSRSQLLQTFKSELELQHNVPFRENAVVEIRVPQENNSKNSGGKKGGNTEINDGRTAEEILDIENNPKATRGFAFVVMKNKELADKAVLALNGFNLEGRKLNVRLSNAGGVVGGKSSSSKGDGKGNSKGKDKNNPNSIALGAGKKGGKEQTNGSAAYYMDNFVTVQPYGKGVLDKDHQYHQQQALNQNHPIIESYRPPRSENAAVAHRIVQHTNSANEVLKRKRDSLEDEDEREGRTRPRRGDETSKKHHREGDSDSDSSSNSRSKSPKAVKKHKKEKKSKKEVLKKQRKKDKKEMKKLKKEEKKLMKKERKERKKAKKKADLEARSSSDESSDEDGGASSSGSD